MTSFVETVSIGLLAGCLIIFIILRLSESNDSWICVANGVKNTECVVAHCDRDGEVAQEVALKQCSIKCDDECTIHHCKDY